MSASVKKFVIIALVLLLAGVQWPALQAIAWGTMLLTRAGSESASAVVAHTFDGQHPCSLCNAINATKKSEKKSTFSYQTLRYEFLPIEPAFTLPVAANFDRIPVPSERADSSSPEPSTPPPRAEAHN